MTTETTAKLINMSGKLRMLSHRICLFLTLVNSAEDEAHCQKLIDQAQASLDEFEKSYKLIVKSVQIVESNSDRLRTLLFDKNTGLHPEVESFITQATNIMLCNKKSKKMDFGMLETLCKFTTNRLLSILNDLTQAFQIDEETHYKTNKHQIGEGLDQIESIGKSIHMISLNAQIEAAKAGDAGKGFSAISNEIQLLSAQTQMAAKSLRKIIVS